MEVMLDEAMLTKLQATQVDINVRVTTSINITSFTARQKVNVLLLDKVGTGGLISESPSFVATAGRLRWRVPVILALPDRGRLGQVGSIDVDVQTGEVLANAPLIDRITYYANQLAANPAL
ncbi:MAG: hypothetical protein B6I38_01335 [Anaerolineaceae bacterium 4572_5.1]|nr:MAG: hypothetical protein B6I38_01335 [Anaerolineaceae bacterium 4572_5.1]